MSTDKPDFYGKNRQIAALTALGCGDSSSSEDDAETSALNAPGFIMSDRA